MNILLINHYVGSPYYGMEFRPYYLAREWTKQGHHVTIIGATYSHLRQHNPVIQDDFQEEIIDGITYVWIQTPAYEGTFSRIYNMFTFVRKLNAHTQRIAQKYQPDVVIASSTYPLDNIPARRIAQRANAQYAYEIHDLWPLSPMLIGGYSKYHPFIVVMQYGENYAYKHADKVISLLWNAKQHCEQHGMPSDKFMCVPNGYDPAEWTKGKMELPLPEEHQAAFRLWKDKTIVGFAGGFAASGNVISLIHAAIALKNRSDIHFVLIGKGPEQAAYEALIAENQLENITILPPVPKHLIPAVNSHFDIAYLGGLHSELHKYGTSYNKMTDYMLCSLPIVQSVDEPRSVVERVGCGIRVEAENVDAIVHAITQLADMPAEQRRAIGKKGKAYAEKNLSWAKLAKDFLSPFENN